ncbi:hypothetical protein Taro_044159 [Colocasia esculenta]|uniref:Uncharacterized protein n=1 Tax=Colocasia esculenta TaxID=4460 RepID=A0A843WIE0_COLES|nr:hypothetical protein [Colocasia esculenta]
MLFFWNALRFLAWDAFGVQGSWTKCVDTQPDCVDTTGFNYSDCFLGQSSSVDTQVDCVDTIVSQCRHTGGLCRHHCDKFV